MRRAQLFLLCLFTVAAVFLTAACGSKNNEVQLDTEPEVDIEVQIDIEPEPEYFVVPRPKSPLKSEPIFSCTHQVGSTVRPGESIRFTYKSANAFVDGELTLKAGGFSYNGESDNFSYSTSATANRVIHCWGEDNCFIATKNGDGGWTIRSLPFQ